MDKPMLNQESGVWAGQTECLGFWSAVGSLAVSMMGTGIVAFPYAFALCGWIGGPLALFILAVLAYLSYSSLLRCTEQCRRVSYTELVEQAGTAWQRYAMWSLWLLLVLAMAAYVIIAADLIRSVVLGDATLQPPLFLGNAVLFAIVLAVMYPLCLTKSLSGVSVVTSYCTCAIFAVVGIIIWRCVVISVSAPPLPEVAPGMDTTPSSIVLALPIFGCAMFGHMNIGQIYGELLPSVKPKANLVAMASCIMVIVLYLCVGCFGYAAFGREAVPDVVAQLAKHDEQGRPISVCQILLSSFIVLKTPLLLFPLRNISLSILEGCRVKDNDHGHSRLDLQGLSAGQNASLTFAILACVYAVGVALPSLDTLLEILGAIAVVPLSFIVPARMAWVIESPRPTLLCVTLGVVGVLISLLSLADVVVGLI